MKTIKYFASLLMLLILFTACAPTELRMEGARQIAKEKYGFSKIDSIFNFGQNDCALWDGAGLNKGGYYVCGLSNGQNKMLIVPVLIEYSPRLANWPFPKTITEIYETIRGKGITFDENAVITSDLSLYDLKYNNDSDIAFYLILELNEGGRLVVMKQNNECKYYSENDKGELEYKEM